VLIFSSTTKVCGLVPDHVPTIRPRARFELIGKGQGIHWPDLDEDLSVEGILAGLRSGESQSSLNRWLERRAVGKHADPTRG
jgi:hypothetical protein